MVGHDQLMVSSRSGHGPLTVGHGQVTLGHGQLTFRSRSAHGTVTVSSQSGHGELTVRSAHGTVTVSSQSGHDQLTVGSQSVIRLEYLKRTLFTHTRAVHFELLNTFKNLSNEDNPATGLLLHQTVCRRSPAPIFDRLFDMQVTVGLNRFT